MTSFIWLTLYRFLLAQLHVNSLKRKRTIKAIRTALNRISAASQTHDQAYDLEYQKAMERIDIQLDDKDLARRVLLWIIFAKEPLTITELEHALAVEIGESDFDAENICPMDDMVSVCAGLVAIDEGGNIRLVHYTTQKYFARTRSIWFPDAEFYMAQTCVTYISYGVFGSDVCESFGDLERRREGFPFYDYASRIWGHHAREASNFIPEVLDFLRKSPISRLQPRQCFLSSISEKMDTGTLRADL